MIPPVLSAMIATKDRLQSGSNNCDQSGSLKEGWLEKKGSFIKSWKRRYFILTPTALDYYTDETKAEHKGSVPILSTSRVMHRDGSSHQFKFGLLTGKRLLEIACTSDKDRTRWKKAIQELINRIQVETMRTGKLAPAMSETATIFEGMIVKNRLDRTNMVEDTPMNRARKKQQEQAQQELQQQAAGSGVGTGPGAGGLKKNLDEQALWGGGDSDESEEEESDGDEEGEGGATSTAKKLARRRHVGGSGAAGGGRERKGSDTPHHISSGRRKDSSKKKKKKPASAAPNNNTKNDNDNADSSSHPPVPDLGGLSVNEGEKRQGEKGDNHLRRNVDITNAQSMKNNCDEIKKEGDGQVNVQDNDVAALDGWEELLSDKGEVYYYHKGAKATRWEKPTRQVTESINRRLEEERRQLETATEKRILEQKQNLFVEAELASYSEQIQDLVTEQVKLWKHPVGRKKPRVLGELLNAIPQLLGPSVVPPDCSLVTQPLQRSDPPALVKKAYRKAVRLVHPDKIAGTGNVIELEKKMMAAEVFIAINEAFEKFRAVHDDM